jgi:hypothetical protein
MDQTTIKTIKNCASRRGSKNLTTVSSGDAAAEESHDNSYNPVPQVAPGSSAPTIGHSGENSIPLSIFPIAVDKFCICFCGLPGRGKTHIARRLSRYLSFFHAMPVKIFVDDGCSKNCEDSEDCGAEKHWISPEAAQCKATEAVVHFLRSNASCVAVYDSTNETHEKRKRLVNAVGSIVLLKGK